MKSTEVRSDQTGYQSHKAKQFSNQSLQYEGEVELANNVCSNPCEIGLESNIGSKPIQENIGTPEFNSITDLSEKQREDAEYIIRHQAPWAQFSKGTGARILCAQNYIPNSGLGVELQGRVQPVAFENRVDYRS